MQVGLMRTVVHAADRRAVVVHRLDEALQALQHLHLSLVERARRGALEEVGDCVGALQDIVVDLHQLGRPRADVGGEIGDAAVVVRDVVRHGEVLS